MTDNKERRDYWFGSTDEFEEKPKQRDPIERAVNALTRAVQSLVQRRDEPAQPPPNIIVQPPEIIVKSPDITVQPPEVKIDFNPEITFQAPDTRVEVTLPDHEEIMVVERDDEGFISRIIKRFVSGTGESETDPFAPKTIGQIVREGLGIGANKEN